MKECFFTTTENALKNLIYTYADHKLMCEEYELDEDGIFDSEYDIHHAHCETAEDWMRSLGIDPMCKFVSDIIEEEMDRRK